MASERGFSLLEVVVALALVGLTVIGALNVATSDLRASRAAAEQLEAASLVEDVLEELTLAARDGTIRIESRDGGGFPPPLDQYRWVARSRAVDYERDLAELTVTVQWPHGSISVATRLPIGNRARP